MDLEPSFGSWLKRRRRGLGLTQAELGQHIGYATDTVRKVEAGEARPSRQMAERMAEELQIPPEEREMFIRFARDQGCEVEPPPLSAPAPAPLPPAPAAEIPAQVTPFIGRGHETAAVAALLHREDVRLLTLAGPPGIGKTRLALHVAEGLQGDFADGASYVNLTPIRDPELVVPTIARGLRVREAADQSPLDALKQALRFSRMLLVLDNFEQVAAAAPQIAELLTATRSLKVLVTSQLILNLRGEHVYTLPPLDRPDPQQLPVGDAGLVPAVAGYAAVQLFVDRAQARQAGFSLTLENARAVAEICRLLDGLPLAIELAAARISLFAPQDMLVALSASRLAPLRSSVRDLPERHRTLRGAIEWSYNLLPDDEQQLFQRLSVFVGGFTLAAVREVCAQGDDFDAAEGLNGLIDRSLVWRAEAEAAEPRYWQLATIHEFGRERLAAGQEAGALRDRHAAYFLALTQAATSGLQGAGQAQWLSRLEDELDNLRAALDWYQAAAAGAESGLLLATSIGMFWEARGHVSEMRRRVAALLASAAAPVSLPRSKGLTLAGNLADVQGDYPSARAYYEESLAIRRHLGDRFGEELLLDNLGRTLLHLGDYTAAYRAASESLAICREIDDKSGIASAMTTLAEVAVCEGALEKAIELTTESLLLHRQLGDEINEAWCLHILGYVNRYLDQPALAAAHLQEGLAMFENLKYLRGVHSCLTGLAGVVLVQGEVERAVELMGAAAALGAGLGMQLPQTEAGQYESDVAFARSRLTQAEFAAAWSRGQALELAQVIDLAQAGRAPNPGRPT